MFTASAIAGPSVVSTSLMRFYPNLRGGQEPTATSLRDGSKVSIALLDVADWSLQMDQGALF